MSVSGSLLRDLKLYLAKHIPCYISYCEYYCKGKATVYIPSNKVAFIQTGNCIFVQKYKLCESYPYPAGKNDSGSPWRLPSGWEKCLGVLSSVITASGRLTIKFQVSPEVWPSTVPGRFFLFVFFNDLVSLDNPLDYLTDCLHLLKYVHYVTFPKLL